MTPAEIDRYLAKVDIRGDDECWPWLASPNRYGYGQFRYEINGRSTVSTAHRFGYEFWTGIRIPPGYEPDHLCLNPLCQNWRHMEVVTKAENVRRGNRTRTRLAYA